MGIDDRKQVFMVGIQAEQYECGRSIAVCTQDGESGGFLLFIGGGVCLGSGEVYSRRVIAISGRKKVEVETQKEQYCHCDAVYIVHD